MTRSLVLAAGFTLAVSSVAAGFDDDHLAGRWWMNSGAGACEHCRLEALARTAPTRDGHYESATGRLKLNYPPHRLVDVSKTRIEIEIASMQNPTLSGLVTHTVTPIGRDLRTLTLACGPKPSMMVSAVGVFDPMGVGPGKAAGPSMAKFEHNGEKLVVTFDPPLTVGVSQQVIVEYTLTDPPDGLFWTPESPAWPGRAAQIHTQGQPETNHLWFPCHDFPNERAATELRVTLPKGYTVLSNGEMTDHHETAGGADIFVWEQTRPHVSYLVSMVVGKFDVVELGSTALPMPVYAPVGKGGLVKRTYGRTPAMIDCFSKFVGEPYPWVKYAQSIVWNFGAGGMENTSCTTMYDTAILDETAFLDGDLDGLISHELAHQWFGDLLTCNSWEHIWLNEGFATYFSHVWFEERDGKDAYTYGLWGNRAGLIANDKAEAPYATGLASKEYANPWEAFRRPANPYPKGAFVLHMLRARLGDELFKKCLAVYVDRFKDRTVETSDLRQVIEEVSGESLERFFAQWVFRPGVPKVAVTTRFEGPATILTFAQQQPIDGYNPPFALDVPVWVRPVRGEWSRRVVSFDTRSHEVTLEGVNASGMVLVDPEATVLADWAVAKPEQAWIAQLKDGPTVGSRLQAATALGRGEEFGGADRPGTVALLNVLRDDSAFYGLRIVCAESLGRLAPTAAVFEKIAASGPRDARVRRAVAEAWATAAVAVARPGSEAAASATTGLAEWAQSDKSYGVRSAAITGLGKLARYAGDKGASIVMNALGSESQHDQVRQAALEAMATMDAPSGAVVARVYAGAGYNTRTRATAIKTAAVLGKGDVPGTVAFLGGHLRDRERRVALAAGESLALLEDERAIAVLEKFKAEARTQDERIAADKCIAAVREAVKNKGVAAKPTPVAPVPVKPAVKGERRNGFAAPVGG